MLPRLIASDLDGTLLLPDKTVSPRVRAALDAAREAGIIVVPVTARQPLGLTVIAEQAGCVDWALCSNGAFAVHLTSGDVLFETHVAPDAQTAFAQALSSRVPGVVFASVRDRGDRFVAQQEYADLTSFTDHQIDPAAMIGHTLTAVLAESSVKFVVRHPEIDPVVLLSEAAALGVDDVAVTHSGAPFLEVSSAGVTKASGLQRLCAHLGIEQREVLAFGDALNDADMLAWAGHGVAMGNAVPEAVAAADEVTLANEEDGLAVVVERLLGA